MIDNTFLEKNMIGSTFWGKKPDRQEILGKRDWQHILEKNI
jgi:hypothetical protein